MAGALLAVAFFLPDAGTGLIEELPLYGLFTIATLLAPHPAPDRLRSTSDGNSQRLSYSGGLLSVIPVPPIPERFFST